MKVPDALHDPGNLPAYAALLAVVARDDPDALSRAMVALKDEAAAPVPGAAAGGDAGAAAELARAWLLAAGNVAAATPADGAARYDFSYPAHVSFELVSGGDGRGARRRARLAIARLLQSDRPLMGVTGPLPDEPEILNATVWLGSTERKAADSLDLEGIED